MDHLNTGETGAEIGPTEKKETPLKEGEISLSQAPPSLQLSQEAASQAAGAALLSSPSLPPLLRPAGFLRRVMAFLIDFVLLEILYLILSFFGILGMRLSQENSLSSSSLRVFTPFIAAWFVLFFGYFTFFHLKEGQTPGKKVLRIKVVNKNGDLLSHGAVLLRSLCYFLSFSFFAVGFLMAIVEKKKRCLHDLLSGSVVILSE